MFELSTPTFKHPVFWADITTKFVLATTKINVAKSQNQSLGQGKLIFWFAYTSENYDAPRVFLIRKILMRVAFSCLKNN